MSWCNIVKTCTIKCKQLKFDISGTAAILTGAGIVTKVSVKS